MPRLSRAESQARTRERLVGTAKDLFLRDGYGPTSLEVVADAAGFSKGAVYSNFRNKNELCLAALDAIHVEQAILVNTAITGARSVDEYISRIEEWAEANIGDQAWTALEVEFAVNARRDEHLRGELAARSRGARDLIAGLIVQLAEELDVELGMPAEDAAATLLSLGIGLGIQRAIDPSIPVTVLTDVIRLATKRQTPVTGVVSTDAGPPLRHAFPPQQGS